MIPIVLPLLFATLAFSGCQSQQQRMVDQAKEQAIKSGQPQQVVFKDEKGDTVTTVVAPPPTGQKEPVVTTTVTPPGQQPPAPPAQTSASASASAPAPPQPVDVPAGTTLTIRIDQRINVKSAHVGDQFSGEVVDPITDSAGDAVIPKGSLVEGRIDQARKRGHFKGASVLELRLTSLTLHGNKYPIQTRDLTETKKGKGKRSTAMIGGGAGAGMLIGGLATGGVGLVIGGLAGAGAGSAGAGLTGNRDIVIPAESVVHFTLADELVLQTS